MGRNESLKALADFATTVYEGAPDAPEKAAAVLLHMGETAGQLGLPEAECSEIGRIAADGMQEIASKMSAYFAGLVDGDVDEAEAAAILHDMLQE